MATIIKGSETAPRWQTIGYWVSTGLFGLLMVQAAFGDFTQADYVLEGVVRLGYPNYLLTILGTAKILGVIALLVPMFPRLKEWAYAGFSVNLLGAVASHLLAGDPIAFTIIPIAYWLIMMVSWYFNSLRTSIRA